MTLLSTLAGLAMAVGAPLVYADQAWSIQKKRDSSGFSKDVCAVLLIANIARCFFWLGAPFELPLLLQSILMIAAQLYLLSLLLKFRPGSYAHAAFTASSADARSGEARTPLFDAQQAAAAAAAQPSSRTPSTPTISVRPPSLDGPAPPELSGPAAGGRGRYAPLLGLELPPAPTLGNEEDDEVAEQAQGSRVWRLVKRCAKLGEGKRADGSEGSRPFGFWTWLSMPPYLLFLAGLVALLTVLHFTLGWSDTYVMVLGYFALGLESTLPVPQAITNQQRRSLSGFRMSVLVGWLAGDTFKTVYFLAQGSPIQFTVCALFQLSIDAVIVAQAYFFREQTAADDEAAAREQAAAMAAREAEEAPIGDEDATPTPRQQPAAAKKQSAGKPRPPPLRDSQPPPQLDRDGARYATVEADSDEER